ncbi:MAG: hypothetical protein M3Y51_03080 [Actinomycetota bacterium]|nr:hypothetical protein [Actinomycetota bacterium]
MSVTAQVRTNHGSRSGRRIAAFRLAAAAAAVVAMLCTSLGTSTAGAAPGDALPQLTSKTTPQTTAAPGDQIQYAINYTCSNNTPASDTCDGATFRDPIPTFTDVFGQVAPLEFVAATGPASVWPSGFTLDTSTDPPAVVSTAGTWAPGTSGVIFVTVRVPVGTVPVDAQIVSNTATIGDPDNASYLDESTTATTSITATAPVWAVSKIGPTTGTRMNRNHVWRVSVCGPPTSSLWPVFEITDTLPAGTEFVGASHGGVFADDGDTAGVSDGAAAVTWTFDSSNRPPIGSDGCFRMTVTARFPIGYVDPDSVDPANDDNVDGAVKTDVASGLGKNVPSDPGVGLGVAPWSTTLLLEQGLGDFDTQKRFRDQAGADNFYATTGDAVRFDLSGSIDSDLPVDRVELRDGTWGFDDGVAASSGDGMPESFSATSVEPGTWNSPITATIEGSDDDFATTTTIAAGVESGDPAVPVSGFRSIRWVWGGPSDSVPGDFAATGQTIHGTLGAPSNVGGLYTNTSRLIVTSDGVDSVDTSSDQYLLEPPLPHAGITKTSTSTSRQPGQTNTYGIRVDNSADATGDLVDPYVEDCVPEHFIVQGAPTLGAGWSVGSPLPTCDAGATPMRFDYTGVLEPGETSPSVSYVIRVAGAADPGGIAPTGVYPNTATVRPDGGGAFGHCRNTTPSCASTRNVVVEPVIELASQKCVTGDLDGGVFRPGPTCDPSESLIAAQTVPGGGMTWSLRLQNTGNTDVDGIDFIDIFPRPGDTAVISGSGGALNPRHSEWTPYLISPIEAPSGWTVSYSTATNPCRGEVGGPTSGCQTPGWVTAPSADQLPSFRSVKFSHAAVLARGASANFTWDMRAPVNDDTYDQDGTEPTDDYEFVDDCAPQSAETDPTHCPRAVNSFAYGADAANLPSGVPQPSRLFAEPPQVEIRVTEPPVLNGIGDRIWYDRDFDGQQSADTSTAGEPGIDGVRVVLFDAADLSTPLDETFTDMNGEYLFSGGGAGLPDGDYVVRVHPPAGYLVSPEGASVSGGDQGPANSTTDSDLPRIATGSDVTGSYHDSSPITLTASGPSGEVDRTWDAGLWTAEPAVSIDKVTKDSDWPDARAGDGVTVFQGRPVTWTYTLTNTGNSRLEDVTLEDDGGQNAAGFAVTDCVVESDGTNADGLSSSATAPFALNRGAVLVCTATGVAERTDYDNVALVEGTPVADDGSALPPGTPPSGSGDVTDSDESSYLSADYDLALATTGEFNSSGELVYTVVVSNEGTVESGSYQVTDVLPPGLEFVSATTPPSSSSGSSATGTTLVWNVATSLAPGAQRALVITTRPEDRSLRPFRNYAEISADSSALVESGGVVTPTTDADSTPDADITNDNTGNGVTDGNGYGAVGAADPTVDNDDIIEAGSRQFPDVGDDVADGEDDADIADSPPFTYDLALAKTVGTVDLTSRAVGFDIVVANQGTLPSGDYTVTDTVPAGLRVVTPVANGGELVPGTAGAPDRVVWNLNGLAPGTSRTLHLDTSVTDQTLAPFHNHAEISSDSASTYDIPGETVSDVDSTPDTDITNDGDYDVAGVDNVGAGAISSAGQGVDPEDDADVAVADVTTRYDLALIKTGPAAIDPTGTATFSITVANQGNVASGAYSVTDLVPAGMVALAANSGGDLSVPTDSVVWTDLPSLAPGESTILTVNMRIVDLTRREFMNSAEITADSSGAYSVTDADSTPGDPATSPVDNASIDDAGVGVDVGFDDEDVATVTTSVRYDLALIKVVESSQRYDATPVFTVRVVNQGNVPSAEFQVEDSVPDGLAVVAADNGGVVSADGRTVLWTVADLAPGASVDLTLTSRISDVTRRPFLNVAEIIADGSSGYSNATETVTDVDSSPGDPATSGSDDTELAHAGVGADAGFDDEDVAQVDVTVRYDLALIKRLPPGQRARLGDTIRFEIVVKNQGDVPSGVFSVQDVLPDGMAFVTATDGAVAGPGTLSWNDLPSIDPGAAKVITLEARLDDITRDAYVNRAEITADSARTYSTATEVVRDVDSTPDTDPDNDALRETDDVDASLSGDEDDHDVAALDVAQVRADNATNDRAEPGERGPSVPAALAMTGTDQALPIRFAAVAVAAGLVLLGLRRRREAG